jgi:hypothetical protein
MENTVEKKPRMEAKDFFIHFFTIIVLYISVISCITLLFQYINLAFPNALDLFSTPGLIRWHLATLIIAFPTFFYLAFYLRKKYRAHPEKYNLSIRKWLIYLTLFLAGLVILCDAIVLLYYFLNGDLTIRFLLKALVMFVIAGLVFYYYLHDLKQNWTTITLRVLTGLASLLVLLTIIYGFAIIGSPFKTRLMKMDQQRIYDLTNIQDQIVNYWRNKNKLPATLDDLTNNISGYKAPYDPETATPYEYKPVSALVFELCTHFNLPAKFPKELELNDDFGSGVNFANQPGWNWQHDKGRACFTRKIEPQFYKRK